MQLRSWGVVAALSLATLVVPTASATAAGLPSCPAGSVCFYSGGNFNGSSWEWNARDGYRDMPPVLADHVGSFVSNAEACLINWQPKETRPVHTGDYRINFKSDFGGRIDGVGNIC